MARVLTKDEAIGSIYDDGWYWIEIHGWKTGDGNGLFHLRCEVATMFHEELECNFDAVSTYVTVSSEQYNVDWRVWNERPDYEQQKNEPWLEKEKHTKFKVHFEGDFEVEAENKDAVWDHIGRMSDTEVREEISYWDVEEGEKT